MCLVMGMATTGFAQSAAKDTHDEIQQTTKAATIFREIMSAPDKAIPRGILDDADCIAVFPQVIKAAFGIGGRGGRGVVVCRDADGWSAPAFLNIGGASFGLQIGAEATDYVMLFMTPESARSLLEQQGQAWRQTYQWRPVRSDAKRGRDRPQVERADSELFAQQRVVRGGCARRRGHRDRRRRHEGRVRRRTRRLPSVLFGGATAPQEVTAFSKTIESFAPR